MTEKSEGRWKVYFVKFDDIKTGRAFYKFGITQNGDAVRRFNPKYDTRWDLFRIRCIGSFWCLTKTEAEAFEKVLHSEYPKNIWLEKYLGHGNWTNLHGITECVALHHGTSEDDEQFREGRILLRSYKGALDFFHELKARAEYQLAAPKPKEYTRAYLQNSLTYEEIQNVDCK